jgi:hypothetical protein
MAKKYVLATGFNGDVVSGIISGDTLQYQMIIHNYKPVAPSLTNLIDKKIC